MLNSDAEAYGGSGDREPRAGSRIPCPSRCQGEALTPWRVTVPPLARGRSSGARDRGPHRDACASGPGRRTPSVPPGTARGSTSPSSREHATAVELCLFEHADDGEPYATVTMPPATDRVWHCYLPDVRPGTLYGYRVDGPYDPDAGAPLQPRQAPHRPLRQGGERTHPLERRALRATPSASPTRTSGLDPRDSAGGMPKCVVVDQAFTWGDDRAPRTPWNRTVIYECHVRGMTMRHPGVPEHLRGTYLGLSSDADDRPPARRSGSPPSSSCRCTSSSPTGTWSSRA